MLDGVVAMADRYLREVMRGQCGGAYAGIALDRTVVQLPGYLLDVYRAWGPARHSFDYPLCFRGTLDRLEGIDTASLKPMAGTTPGYKHILAVGPEDAESGWSGVWSREAAAPDPNGLTTDERRGGPANRVLATLLPAPGLEVFLATVPGKRHQAILRRTGRDVTFVCLVDPYRARDVRSVRALATTGPISATGVEVLRTDGGIDYIVVRNDPMPEGTPGPPTSFAGTTTQALVTVSRIDKDGAEVCRIDLGGSP